MIVDGGPCRFAKSSTIVRIGSGPCGDGRITIEREGVYDERTVRRLMRWTLLLVCSGNTCRSPMAQAMAQEFLARQRGIGVEDLEAAGLQVRSAGTFAAEGSPASPFAIQTMADMGLDLTRHRAARLTPQLLQSADLVYCMTSAHRAEAERVCPAAAHKITTVDPDRDVEDPIGDGPKAYQRCAELIRRRLDSRLKGLQI